MIGEPIILACVVLGPLAFGCVEDWSAALLRALLALILLPAPRQVPGRPPLLHRSFLPAVLGLMATGVLQRFFPSAAGAPRFFPLLTAAPWATEKALLNLACLAALLWRGPGALAGEGSGRRFAWVLATTGAAVALIGIIQNSAGNQWVYGFRDVRSGRVPFGPYFNHNHATTLMGMSLLAGLGLFAARLAELWRRLAMGERLSDFVALQVLLLGELALLAWGIAASVSRGGYLAIALSLLAVMTLTGALAADPRRRAKILLATGAAILILAASARLQPRWVGIIHGALDRSSASRVSLYRTGLRMIQDNPVFGVGLGAFQEVFGAYQMTEPGYLIDHIHNDWLEMILETGIVGFALYGGGLALFLAGILRKWRFLPPERQALSAGGFGAALVYVLHGFLDYPFHIPANAVVFFAVLVWLGHISSAQRPAKEGGGQDRIPSETPRPWAARAIALVLVMWALRPAAAAWETRRAKREDPIRHLERAWELDPDPVRLHRLAVQEYLLARGGSPESTDRLRRALMKSELALALRPLNPDTRNLHAALLAALGRPQDAAPLVTLSLK